MSATRPRLTAPQRRQVVLNTACRVFFAKSYRGATMAEIARESGITEPILYRHFGSKRDLYLACLDEAWRAFREVAETALVENPDKCLGAVSDAYMAKKSKLRLIDLWIQALTEAAEDTVIAAAVGRQLREVHDFFADVTRPRPGRRGLGLHRRRPAGDDRPASRRPARRRSGARPGRPPGLDGRRSDLRRKRAPAAAPGALSSGGALCVRRPRGTGSAAGRPSGFAPRRSPGTGRKVAAGCKV